MSNWNVLYTEQAERDLREIFEYIACSLLEPEIAKNQVRRMMNKIVKLNNLPFRYPLYEKDPWYSKGLRVLPVDNYLVFYLPVETQKAVVIIRIMYGGRDIVTQLPKTE